MMNKYLAILTITLIFFSCKKEEDNTPYTVRGCTNSLACNYDSIANSDDGSCILPDGCTDSTAFNYNPLALCDDGSCNYAPITNLNIHFKQTVDGYPLILDQMIYTNQAGENYSVQTVRYLISDITLHTVNGTNTLLDKVHFIDISNSSTLSLNIPEIDNKIYTSISFTMGLDPIKNVTDSFLNESFFPSFSWPEFLGGGYHYMQLEGNFNTVLDGYATHTGGTNGIDFSFNKAFPVTISQTNNIRDIYINMEITNWYQNPEIFNFTTNGIMGDPNSQIILQANGIEDVFSVYPVASFDCVGTGCIDPGTEMGQYTTLAACQAVCTASSSE